MELLTVRHQDFTMTIECSKFDGVWAKAVRNVGEENLTSTYSWSDGVVAVIRQDEDGGEVAVGQGEVAPAVFFDNTEYPIWVEFKDYVKKARFGSILQSDNDNFSFRRGNLVGFINYGNDIGKSEILIDYTVGSELRHFRFGFDVLSTKLNYHEHWRQIIEDIESEYRMLSLDYMKRTFHGFSPDIEGETPELVWWSVFAGEQQKFINAVKSIIERPRHRLQGIESFVRADKLTRIPISIENELSEHRKEPAHLYRVEQRFQSHDTPENRFLKHAIFQITAKYESLKNRIEEIRGASDSFKEEMQITLNTLKHLQRNPFFRTVGRFKEMNQESLVLHKATGYSQVYRSWFIIPNTLIEKTIASAWNTSWCLLSHKNPTSFCSLQSTTFNVI